MASKTLTIRHASGGSETYTIKRDKFAGVREMTIDGKTVSVDHTAVPKEQDREKTFGGSQSITVKRDIEPLLKDVVGGAAAAYSLRDLNDVLGNSNKVVRVRRSSDNAEKDFTALQVSSGEMTNWVNSQIVPPLDIGVETADGRVSVPDGGTSIGTPAAAYSLRNLSSTYTGNVVKVRRSSDNAERDFTASEVANDEGPNVVDLYAISGQSNAAGRANISDAGNRFDDLDALSSRVFIWNRNSSSFEEFDFAVNQHKTGGSSNQFGPESELLRLAALDNPNKTIYVVKYTEGGTSLYSDWDSDAGSNYYSDFVGDYNNAVSLLSSQNLTVRHRGVLYAQGERDSKNNLGGGVASYYKDKQKALVENLRTDLNQPSLPVALTLISVRGTLGDTYTHVAEVNQAKEQVANELNNVTTISSLNFGFKSDDLHYNGDGQIAHGAAFFEYTDSFEYNSALETWVGDGNDGFVQRWYDQSGSGNDATATTLSKQPKIVNGGHSVGGVKFDGVDDRLAANGVNISQPISFFSVIEAATSKGFFGGEGAEFEVHSGGTGQYVLYCGTPLLSSTNQTVGDIDLLSGLADSSSSLLRKNGTEIASGDSGTAGVSNFHIGVADRIARYTDGVIKEIIIYDSDQSDNSTAIEANIGEHYGISGIPAYDNTVNGYVETWYDQSGNGNDATQTVAASQPKIVDGGTYLGELDFDGINDELDTDSSFAPDQPITAFVVSNIADSCSYFSIGASTESFRILSSAGSKAALNAGSPLSSTADVTDEETLLTAVGNTTSSSIFKNGTSVASGDIGTAPTGTPEGLKIGNLHGIPRFTDGFFKELIIYPSNQSNNRPAIEKNINNYYEIY